MRQALRRLLNDECGGEAMEYALIASLIVISVITSISAVGCKVVSRWVGVNTSL